MSTGTALHWITEGAPGHRSALCRFRCRRDRERVGGRWVDAPGYERQAQRLIQAIQPNTTDQVTKTGWVDGELVTVVNLDLSEPHDAYLRVIGVQVGHQGKGYAHEGFSLALRAADEAARAAGLLAYRITAKVHRANHASQAVLRRGGMAFSGEWDGPDLQMWSAYVML